MTQVGMRRAGRDVGPSRTGSPRFSAFSQVLEQDGQWVGETQARQAPRRPRGAPGGAGAAGQGGRAGARAAAEGGGRAGARGPAEGAAGAAGQADGGRGGAHGAAAGQVRPAQPAAGRGALAGRRRAAGLAREGAAGRPPRGLGLGLPAQQAGGKGRGVCGAHEQDLRPQQAPGVLLREGESQEGLQVRGARSGWAGRGAPPASSGKGDTTALGCGRRGPPAWVGPGEGPLKAELPFPRGRRSAGPWDACTRELSSRRSRRLVILSAPRAVRGGRPRRSARRSGLGCGHGSPCMVGVLNPAARTDGKRQGEEEAGCSEGGEFVLTPRRGRSTTGRRCETPRGC